MPQGPVPDAHDVPVFGPGRDLELFGQRDLPNDEGMIADGPERVLEAAEDPPAVVEDLRRFAVEERRRPDDLSSERLADA